MTANPASSLAIVTGASSGIGRAATIRFLQAGWRVLATARNSGRLEELRRAAPAERALHLVPADLATGGSGPKIVQEAVRFGSRIDALIHCAAIAPLAPLEETTAEQFDAVWQLNIRGSWELLQAVFRQMKGQGGGGSIVNISSLAAVDPFPGLGIYGASKGWLDTLTRAIANEGRPHGIYAWSIRPGAVDTPMLRGLFPDFPESQTVSADDVAGVALELTGAAWRQTSGQAIAVSAQES